MSAFSASLSRYMTAALLFYVSNTQKTTDSIPKTASVENGDISLYDDTYTGVNLHGSKFRRDGGMDADSSRLRPFLKSLASSY